MTIVEAFGEVVKAAEAELVKAGTVSLLNYQYGHPKAILQVMQQYSKSTQAIQAKMYPLVALFQDFTETRPARVGQLPTVSLRFIIANLTQAAYDTPERYEKNFKPILQPIYDELIHQLRKSGLIGSTAIPQHAKIDRPYWGKEGLYGNEGNIFEDAMDVIEIRDLQLSVRPEPKCIPASFKTF